MPKAKSPRSAVPTPVIDPPAGIYTATFVARARNSPQTLVLTFGIAEGNFILTVSSRYGYAPVFGGPSFADAPSGELYVLAVRHLGDRPARLEYAMALAAAVAAKRQSNYPVRHR